MQERAYHEADTQTRKDAVMPRRETGESSQPRAMEQGERPQTAFPHETQAMRDVVRHHHAFSASLEPDPSNSVETGSATLERRGKKRSAEQASLTSPSTVPESVSQKRSLSDATRAKFSRQRRIDKLFGEGLFSDQAIEKRLAAMKRPEVKEKHQAAMKRPEVKEKHQAVLEKQKQEGTGLYAPEAKAARIVTLKATLEKQKQEGSGFFSPEELATANSAASQAIGGGKSYAWMKAGKPASQQ